MKRRLVSVVLSAILCMSSLIGCMNVDIDLSSLDLERYGLTPESIAKEFSTNFSDTYNGVQKLSVDIPDVEEATQLILSNKEFLEGMSQADLDLRLGKKGATLEEYEKFLADQVREITPGEKLIIKDAVESLQTKFDEIGFTVPSLDSIEFVKTTMLEEDGATAYTHANQIYFGEEILENVHDDEEKYQEFFDEVMAHEVFHVLSRNDREFKENMYRLIGFTLDDSEPDFSPEVREKIISNPDVESFDAHATFTIDGEPTDGVIVFYLDGDYEAGESFFDVGKAGIVPIDKPDRIIPVEEVPDFNDVVGNNTDYVSAAEEILADNFAYALTYGESRDYADPGIITGLLDYLKTGVETVRATGGSEADASEGELSIEEIAMEVIKGLWGNGADRVEALEDAGYDVKEVQGEVNELMGN